MKQLLFPESFYGSLELVGPGWFTWVICSSPEDIAVTRRLLRPHRQGWRLIPLWLLFTPESHGLGGVEEGYFPKGK